MIWFLLRFLPAKCQLFIGVSVGTSGGTTTNWFDHSKWKHPQEFIRGGAKNTRADHIQTNVNNRSDRIRIVISRQLSNVFMLIHIHTCLLPSVTLLLHAITPEAPPPLWERLQEEPNAAVGFLPYYSHAHAFTACSCGTTIWSTLLQLCLADSSSSLE